MNTPAEGEFGQLLAAGIGLMLLAAGALVLFLVVHQKRLLEQQLRLRTAETEHQQQLLVAVIEAQERERERIGRDLHDGIGSAIATAKLLVNRLDSSAGADLVGLLRQLMGAAAQDLRSVSHSLFPAVLARFGLAEALQHLVEVSNEAGPLAIELAIEYPGSLALAEELALYRICQELLHNALKHAKGATRLRVHLLQQGSLLTLSVEDDGCGFDPAALASPTAAASGGAGLRSIDVRVQMLGAHWQQHTGPGQGTCTIIELLAPALQP